MEQEGLALLMQCDHPNIVKVYDVFLNGQKLYVVMEYLEGYELFAYITKVKLSPFEEEDSKVISKTIALALQYLHQHGIMHRDIKLENLKFRDAGDNPDLTQIVLLDFGFAAGIPDAEDQSPQDKCGTTNYAAPEMFDTDSRYDQGIDIWSFIVVVYSYSMGFGAFSGETDPLLKSNIQSRNFYRGGRFLAYSEEFRHLVSTVFNAPIEKRPSISELLTMPWFYEKK